MSLCDHTSAIQPDGSLWIWGYNFFGQLGTGNTVNKYYPVKLGSSSWSKVSCGGNVTAAIRSDGALFTWGQNSTGQLGDGSTINRYSPVQIGTSSWIAIACGYTTSSIRSDGALFNWGRNSAGQLGDGTTVNKSSPVQIGTSSWSIVSVGASHAAAIRSDGALFTWGYAAGGILGDGTTVNKSSPVLIGSSSWIAVACGAFHNLSINSNNKLYSWGQGLNGVLGDGTTVNKSSPVLIGSSSWIAVACGVYHSLGLVTGGINNPLYSWGINSAGQLGDGTTVSKSSPVVVVPTSAAKLFVGNSHTCFIDVYGGLTTFGLNNYGQLGYNDTSNKWSTDHPVIENFSPTTINSSLSVGLSHTALIGDSSVFVWGLNTSGQIGNTSAVSQSQPTALYLQPNQTNDSWSIVSCGGQHTAAIKNDGGLFNWGLGTSGQLGQPTSAFSRSSPSQVGASSWSSVSCGRLHTAALLTDNSLFVWGANNLNQVGDGTTVGKSSPIKIGSFTKIYTGGDHNIAK